VWSNDPDPLTFEELGAMGVRFLFITLGGQHAAGYRLSTLLAGLRDRKQDAYIELQRLEWAEGADIPTRSHHQFSGVPCHHLVGSAHDAARLGTEFVEELPDARVV
jgi:isocitrate lyase